MVTRIEAGGFHFINITRKRNWRDALLFHSIPSQLQKRNANRSRRLLFSSTQPKGKKGRRDALLFYSILQNKEPVNRRREALRFHSTKRKTWGLKLLLVYSILQIQNKRNEDTKILYSILLLFYSIQQTNANGRRSSSIPNHYTKQQNANRSRRLLLHLHNKIEDVISSIPIYPIINKSQTSLQSAFCGFLWWRNPLLGIMNCKNLKTSIFQIIWKTSS